MGANDGVNRRTVLRTAGAASLVGFAGCLGGNGGETDPEDYPESDVEIVVPFASGGGFDEYTRLSESYWEDHLGGDVVVSNVEGGGGVTGATQTYNADPDGHKFMIFDTYQAITQQIARDVSYDIIEMSHIGTITNDPSALVVTDEADIDGWDDMIDRIDELSFATQGNGSAGHTLPALLAMYVDELEVEDLNFVHFDGTGEVIAGLERGEADIFFISTITSGVATVQALEGASMFMAFDDEDEIGWYLEDEGVETELYSTEVDINDVEEFNELAYMRRFFTGPPGVNEEILEIQRDAFESFAFDDEFAEYMGENGRPVINPGDGQQAEDHLTNFHDTVSEDPYLSVFQDLMS